MPSAFSIYDADLSSSLVPYFPVYSMANSQPCVLLTGGTGFLGKVILQELARQRLSKELPDHRVIVLIRNNKKLCSTARFQKLSTSKCFSNLPSDWISNVEVVTGDLTSKCCGISPDAFATICGEVTHIIHCAASIDFNLPLVQAAISNVSTCLELMELAENCPKLAKMIVVSTAYVRPFESTLLRETLVPLPRPAESLYAAILDGSTDEKGLLLETKHPNTYTLTKCITEHLVSSRRRQIPITILRPSIISAAWKYPFPAWLDSRAALGGYAALFGAGFLHVIEGSRDTTFDVVPVDVVANHAIFESGLQLFETDSYREPPPSYSNELKIVHSVAGRQNGLPAELLISISQRYFDDHTVFKRPSLSYVGPKTPKYYWHQTVSQTIPLQLARLYYTATRKESMSKRISHIQRGIAAVDKCFPYFCSHTFDFDQSHGLLTGFCPAKYIEIICLGVHKHLLLGDIYNSQDLYARPEAAARL